MKAYLSWKIALGGLFALGFMGVACGADEPEEEFVIGTGGSGTGGSGGSTTGGASTGGEGGSLTLDSIVDIAVGDENFTILVEAAQKAGLTDALTDDGLTVFAPTNEAFEALFVDLGVDSVDDLTVEQLTPILKYHVVPDELDSAAALEVSMGSGQVETLGGFANIEVVADELTIDDRATVVEADIMASNGIIHVIDAVLLPSITDIVISSEEFSELAGAVATADEGDGMPKIGPTLDEASPEGAYTLFAPDNDAVIAATMAVDPFPENQVLTNVILYHVVSAEEPITGADALALPADTAVESLLGQDLTVSGGMSVTIAEGLGGEATVSTADIYAENGVIHVIDRVLVPNLGN